MASTEGPPHSSCRRRSRSQNSRNNRSRGVGGVTGPWSRVRPAALYSALVTRPGRSPRGLAALFAADQLAAVLKVVREARAGLTAAEVKAALRAAGVAPAALEKGPWGRLQQRLRGDERIVVEPGYRYRYAPKPTAKPDARPQEPAGDGARHRQARLDGVRALAELASEVEELSVNEASARAMIHRVRGRVGLSGLAAIERAGESTTFDRHRHQPIGPPIRDGAPVMVVRPGYAWRDGDEEVLVLRAVVAE